MQLVAAVERQLEVLVGERVADRVRDGGAASAWTGAVQRGEQGLGERPARFGKGQHGDRFIPG